MIVSFVMSISDCSDSDSIHRNGKMKIADTMSLKRKPTTPPIPFLALYINQRLPFLLIVHLAAQQAESLVEDKNIIVIPSKTIPQGISAMINFVGNKSIGENEKNMSTEMLNIKSGQVTYAVRDTNMDGKDIKQGDFMGLTDKTIVAVEKNVDDATKALIAEMIDDDAELVSIYYGADVSEEEAEKLANSLETEYEDIEFEVQYGGQPVYSYFVSVE